jgi:hypothetical protein
MAHSYTSDMLCELSRTHIVRQRARTDRRTAIERTVERTWRGGRIEPGDWRRAPVVVVGCLCVTCYWLAQLDQLFELPYRRDADYVEAVEQRLRSTAISCGVLREILAIATTAALSIRVG